MLSGFIRQAQRTAKQTARKAALGLVGGLFALAGTSFLTLAAWLYLMTVTTALNAALILGAAYMGLELIFLALSAAKTGPSAHQKPAEPAEPKQDDMMSQVVTAFMTGVQAGQKARS